MQHKRGRSRDGGFLYGAAVLTVGMAVVKLLGALFKVPLKYTIGEYGMGLFNVAYSFWAPVFALATAGLPAAVSRLVSESRIRGGWREVLQVKKVAMPLFLTLGLLATALMIVFAPLYCGRVMGSNRALPAMLALAPAVLLGCAASVYRGWFEGLQEMAPTAVSQVLEASIKLLLGISLSRWALEAAHREFSQQGTVFSFVPESPQAARLLELSFAAAGAILGVTLGSAASLLYLAVRAHRALPASPLLCGSAPERRNRAIVRRLAAVTAPVAVGSVAASSAGLIDATVLQGRLTALLADHPGFADRFAGILPADSGTDPASLATFLYGCYTLAMTVYLLVPALSQAIGVSALPSVTQAWAQGGPDLLRERISAVLRVTALVCVPAGLGLSAVAEPLIRLLYGDAPSSALVAEVLALLGPAAIFAAMSTPLSSLLQAVGRPDLPVKLILAAMALKLLANRFLCGLETVHVFGAALGTLFCYCFLTLGELILLTRVTKIRLPWRQLFWPPVCCGGICAVGAFFAWKKLENCISFSRLGTLVGLGAAVLFGGILYFFGLWMFGQKTKSQNNRTKPGQKIAKTLEKRG